MRFFNTVGPRQTGQYGMVLPSFVQQALAGEPITVFGDGTQSRSFTYIGDVVGCLMKLVNEPKAIGEVFNIGNKEEVTILKLAEIVKALTGSASPDRVRSLRQGVRSRLRGHAAARAGPDQDPRSWSATSQKCSSTKSSPKSSNTSASHGLLTYTGSLAPKPDEKACFRAVAAGAASASPCWAAGLKLSIHDGKVSLDAQDVTVRQILTEWARVGKTRIVNLERVTGGPITLKLDDVPEKQALDIILRPFPGYMAAPRATLVADASLYDRILIMATTTAVAALRPQQPAPGFPACRVRFPGAGGNITQLRPDRRRRSPRDAARAARLATIRWTIRPSRQRLPPASFLFLRSTPGLRADPAPLMPPGGAAHRSQRRPRRQSASAVESVERAGRHRAAESRAAASARADAADLARASAAGRSISVRRDTIRRRSQRSRHAHTMPEIDRYRPEDQRGVEALYRRVFGPDAAAASRLRWDWQYRRNPNNPDGAPLLWVVREGPTIIGHYATMPVRLSLGGKEIHAAWGTDAMVAPERQRRGLGEELFRTWDRSVGASLGLGLSDSSSRAAEEDALSRRAADSRTREAADPPRRPPAAVADGAQSLRLGRHAADRPRRRARAAASRRRGADPALRCVVHRAVGAARRSIRAGGSPRRGVPELEVHRAAARAILASPR